jgi:hypothetical protein
MEGRGNRCHRAVYAKQLPNTDLRDEEIKDSTAASLLGRKKMQYLLRSKIL